MTTFKVYDALGIGMNMNDDSSSPFNIDEMDVDGDPNFSQAGSQITVSFSMGHGALHVTAILSAAGPYSMVMNSMSIANSANPWQTFPA